MNGRNEGGRHSADTRRLGVPLKARVDPEPKAAKAGLPARERRNWLMPIAPLAAASVALVSDGALFRESGQLAAVVVVLCLGLVLAVSRWSRVRAFLGSRLGLLAVVDGAVLVLSAILSVYHWASIREVLKAAALGEAFLLGAALIDRETLRDRFLVLFYWWSVVAAGAGSILYVVGMRWPQSWLGSYAVRTLATSTNRLSAFFGYANAFAAFLLVPIAMGVAFAWRGGRRGTAALVGLIIPLYAMQLAASRWGYVVLGLVLTAMLILGMRLAAKGGFRRMRVAVVTCAVLVVAGASMLMPGWTFSSSAPDIGERFTDIGAEVRNTDPVTSSIGGRIAMIRDALHYAAAYPILGSGPGTYSSTYFRFRSTNFFAADPHSQAMLWLTETGGIGFAAQTLLMLAVLGLVWIAAVRDAGRNSLLLGAAFGITGVLAHAMLDWDFQSYFLPLMVAVLCGVAVSMLAGHDTWLLRPWRRAPEGVRTASRLVGKPQMDWRSLTIAGMSLCIALAALSTTAALVAEKGIAAYEAGGITDAARFFSTSQSLNPLNAEYPYLRAKTNMAQPAGDSAPSVDQAVRDGFERAVALNPWYIKYQIEQARYLLGRGDTESVALYENLTRIDPGDPGTFTSLAWAYHVLYQNDAKAMQSLDQAFAVDETYYEAWLVLGRIQEAKGMTSEAIAAYWKAFKGNRADVQALGRLGNLYDQSGNSAGAARAAFELLQRTPESADAKSAFAAVGMSITLDRVTLEGRQASLSWMTSGKQVAESYKLALVRPNVEDTVVAEGTATGQVSLQASIAQAVPSGVCRLRLYAMAPVALAGVEDPWVAWAESDELVLGDP